MALMNFTKWIVLIFAAEYAMFAAMWIYGTLAGYYPSQDRS